MKGAKGGFGSHPPHRCGLPRGAERAKAKGIEKVVFDRNGSLYHGRVKALAEAARQKGLVF